MPRSFILNSLRLGEEVPSEEVHCTVQLTFSITTIERYRSMLVDISLYPTRNEVYSLQTERAKNLEKGPWRRLDLPSPFITWHTLEFWKVQRLNLRTIGIGRAPPRSHPSYPLLPQQNGQESCRHSALYFISQGKRHPILPSRVLAKTETLRSLFIDPSSWIPSSGRKSH